MPNTAARLYDLHVPPNADVHISVEPNDNDPVLVDTTGHELTKKESLMTRADTKLSEKVVISKGFLAAIGVLPALLMVVFSYGASFVGIVQKDTTQQVQMQQMQNDINDLKVTVKGISDSLQAIKEQNAYRLGVQAGSPDSSEVSKKK
jgi:hypothetical protein